MPDITDVDGRQSVVELRTRLFTEGLFDPSDRIHLRLGAYVDTLAGHRESGAPDGGVGAAVLRPMDVYAEWRGQRYDLRAGMGRIAWGRLDEFQPTDVVNRLDAQKERLLDIKLNMAALRSEFQDVDMAEAFSEVAVQDVIYKASLQAGAKAIQPSLIDYLR